MKIGFICNEYPPVTCGGIGTFTRELAERLVQAGHHVHVIGVYAGQTSIKIAEQNGVLVERLPARGGLIGLYSDRRRLYRRVNTLAKAGELDVIEVPDFEGGAAFWGRLSIPRVVRLHGTVTYFNQELEQPANKLTKRLELSTLVNSDCWLSVSDYAAQETCNAFAIKKPYEVIYNGIAWPSKEQCKQDYSASARVVFTGSLMAKKGVFSLAKAWRQLHQIMPNLTLVLIGKDTVVQGRSAKDFIVELAGDVANIEFTGHIDKATLQQHLTNADVAIFPSFSESFGLGPVEAMALAVPTIYTQLSCGPEIMKDKRDGLLIDPTEPDTIVSALTSLLTDESLRRQYGCAGRAHAEKFSIDAQLAHNVKAYQQLIEAHS